MTFRWLVCLAMICLSAAAARADFAPDLTGRANITASHSKNVLAALTDGNYRTEWTGGPGAWVEFSLPDDQPCSTLYVLSGMQPDLYRVEAAIGGGWREIPIPGDRFNTQCIPLDGLTRFRIVSTDRQLRLMEVRLYGAGELPDGVVRFRPEAGKADLLVLACHPDDDILWLGALMPIYAGQLRMEVQVAYMTARFSYRRCEAIDALWHCGVTRGPAFVGLKDSGSISYTEAVEQWGGQTETARKIARLIRRWQPEVLATQDVKGEYGHIQHRAMVAACSLAVRLAADPGERTLRDLPPWQVKKYYIHLYNEDPLVLDCARPLDAFGGKSAFQVAEEAFQFHKSQQVGRYQVAMDGPYDIRRYGLAYSDVGPDERHDGLFEHIDGLYEREEALWSSPQ